MRRGRLLLVLALIGTAASGAAKAPPEAIARARHLFESAVIYERLGQYQHAADTLTQAIQTRALQGEDAARALFDRGVAFDGLGQTQRALSDYSAALRLAPRLSAALSNRANVYRRLGRFEEAKRDYLTALHCPGVESQYPYYGLGLIAEKLGDDDTARDYLQKALAVDPSFALAAQSLSALKKPPTMASTLPAQASHETVTLRRPVERKPAVGVSDVVPNNPALITERSEPPKASAPPVQKLAKADPLNLRRTISDAVDEGHTAATVQIQLGAFRDERTALEAWSRISITAAATLDGLQPVVVVADLPGRGRFWRLRTILPNIQAARKVCTALTSKGQACILARD